MYCIRLGITSVPQLTFSTMEILFQQRTIPPMQSSLFSPVSYGDFQRMFDPEKRDLNEMLAHATTYLERAQETIGEMKKKSAVSSELLTKQSCTMYQRATLMNLLAAKRLVAASAKSATTPAVKVQYQSSLDTLPTIKVVNA